MRRNVLVFSIAMNGYQWLYRSLRNSHQAYAERNGYQYVQVNRPCSSLLGIEVAWLKISLAIQSLRAGYDWIMFLDADTRVSSQTPPIESLEEKGKYLYAVKGFSNRLNSGVLILKNHQCVMNLLQKTLHYAELPVQTENDVGWGENGHLIEFTKDAFYLKFIHHRWNNNQSPGLQDFIRHYSYGPMNSLFKPGWWNNCLYQIHFHGVCVLTRMLSTRNRSTLSFHERLENLTGRVIELYPALVNKPSRDYTEDCVSHG